MRSTRPYDEERLAELIAALPPPPRGWVRAAQELPLARVGMDEIVARVEADLEFRRACIADLEAAVAAAGVEPHPALLDAIRQHLSP